ncbi:hypothetical protein PACTADRAFT_32343 [Pachysolen tannophilus NRRL Y-2460]|uniref:Thioredoxin domain-containing protein n=1 Tax=Pachysolen tannophilus NRRL Y-2460 TaxID=669874 RepID=A0A1E4TYJ2_PACTA|nr:hypothetical protein PACTADRAFT_32343 [Pachysolen tannophilus NRRL Y-2460]
MSRVLLRPFLRSQASALQNPGSQQIRLNSSLIKEVTSLKQFKEEIATPKLSVVDFYATWCGPCKAIAPVLENFSNSYKDSTNFLKVDVDQNEEVAMEYGVSAMPTFVLFKNGEGIGKIVGANAQGLKKAIEEYK